MNFEERYLSYVGVYAAGSGRGRCSEIQGNHVCRAPFTELLRTGLRRSLCRRMLGVDMATQLPDDLLMLTDKMSMATSLECRVPLLDNDLVELAARMPSAQKDLRGRELKHVMKRGFIGCASRGYPVPEKTWIRSTHGRLAEERVISSTEFGSVETGSR